MRFAPFIPFLLTTGATALSFPQASTFIPLPSCLNLRSVLEATDTAALTTTILTEICTDPSNPTNKRTLPLIPTTYTSTWRPFLQQIVDAETANMGAPYLSASYMRLLDALFNLGRTQCGLDAFEDDICAASQAQLEAVVDCIKWNGWQVAIANVLNILPLLSLDACNRQVDFFARDEVVDVLLPQYAREFASGL
ncbi:hypothetical protein BJY01DRAFT_253043 [Aspergillus pseudoustus]|uniref:Uncharacterized protein n=1 Tax=Aspergillus pseudoustus TaxID=1810923 RepID=A0ABR4J3H1_9EURO